MTTKEKFIKVYNAHVQFEKVFQRLFEMGIYAEESHMVSAFYEVHDLLLQELLNEEGLELFYEKFLFNGFSAEEIIDDLDPYFITR